jgi:hypothetical protein
MRTWRTAGAVLGFEILTLLLPGSAQADLTAIAPNPPPQRWYEWIDVSAFVDAYASFNYNVPKPQADSNALRVFDRNNGFSLSWVGIDIGHEPDPVGARLALRFGPSALVHGSNCLSQDRLLNPCDTEAGAANVKTAKVAWRPFSALTLAFGKFEAPFGAETAESQDNINYTRGLLYDRAYPSFHTGLSAELALAQALDVNLLVANGWNNSIDNNLGKSVGLGAALRPVHGLEIKLGWLFGPEQDDVIRVPCPAGSSYSPDAGGCAADAQATAAAVYNVDRGGANQPEAWRHLLDLKVEARPNASLHIVAGADYGVENLKSRLADDGELSTQRYYGAMLAGHYELTPVWAVGARGEYLGDPEGLLTGTADGQLASATLTIDARVGELLLLRLENRGDFELNGHDIFPEDVRGATNLQFTTTLGAVVGIN